MRAHTDMQTRTLTHTHTGTRAHSHLGHGPAASSAHPDGTWLTAVALGANWAWHWANRAWPGPTVHGTGPLTRGMALGHPGMALGRHALRLKGRVAINSMPDEVRARASDGAHAADAPASVRVG
jgi:hypothetical protein